MDEIIDLVEHQVIGLRHMGEPVAVSHISIPFSPLVLRIRYQLLCNLGITARGRTWLLKISSETIAEHTVWMEINLLTGAPAQRLVSSLT